MKRLLVLLSLSVLGGCVCVPCLDLRPLPVARAAPVSVAAPPVAVGVPPAATGNVRVAFEGVEIERVAFRTGVSSATVEHLAAQVSCSGGMGAGLMTAPGPVEVYKMACDNGKVFLARCELRQCKAM